MKTKVDLNLEKTVTFRRSTVVFAVIATAIVVNSMRRTSFLDGYLTAVDQVVTAAAPTLS
jgi:hypothetical protein